MGRLTPAQIASIRDFARIRLGETTVPGGAMARKAYILAVVNHVTAEFGAEEEIRMTAERTARHMWDSSGR